MVDAALRAAGHRSARYTSPHLVDLAGAIRHRRPAGRDERARRAPSRTCATRSTSLRADGELEVQPTFFEVTTAVAFELFRRAGVEIAVLEVGLGGRLDATNVVAPPHSSPPRSPRSRSIISCTSARRCAEIALEKAGIIKPGVPVVVGPLRAEARGGDRARSRASAAPRSIRATRRRCRRLRRSACAGAHQTRERGGRRAAAADRSTRAAFAVPAHGDRARGSPTRSGRAGSSRAGCPTAASCCSTPRTTRPAPPRSRPISQSDGGRAAAAGVRGDARQGRRRHVRGAAAGGRAA